LESIYGAHRQELEETRDYLLEEIQKIREDMAKKTGGEDPVEHCLARIKSEESMREKCRRKGLPENEHSALEEIHDAVGIRIVCSFLSDVYTIRDGLAGLPACEVVEEKDYIRHAKPNGYRSYHLILKVERGPQPVYAEIQLRTISQDTWAALEHHMKYKKAMSGDDALISAELKRCADELASTDLSMQTIRDMIYQDKKETTDENTAG
jgi:putative GTP pyrophosphokinase